MAPQTTDVHAVPPTRPSTSGRSTENPIYYYVKPPITPSTRVALNEMLIGALLRCPAQATAPTPLPSRAPPRSQS